jgi:hypothetical protein
MNFDSAVAMIFDPAIAMIFDLAGNNKFDLHVKILRPRGAEDFARHTSTPGSQHFDDFSDR